MTCTQLACSFASLRAWAAATPPRGNRAVTTSFAPVRAIGSRAPSSMRKCRTSLALMRRAWSSTPNSRACSARTTAMATISCGSVDRLQNGSRWRLSTSLMAAVFPAALLALDGATTATNRARFARRSSARGDRAASVVAASGQIAASKACWRRTRPSC